MKRSVKFSIQILSKSHAKVLNIENAVEFNFSVSKLFGKTQLHVVHPGEHIVPMELRT